MLDVCYALVTEGMDTEQREKFDTLVDQEAGRGSSTTGAEMAQRRAYALAQGEIG